MKFPEEFLYEMNDFFSRYKYVPQEGFYESFEKEPLKGIRFSRTKINSVDEERSLLDSLGEGENPVPWCSGGYYINNETGGKEALYHAGVYYPRSLRRCFLHRSWQQSPAR